MRRTTRVISLIDNQPRTKPISRFLNIYFFFIHIITCCNFGFHDGRVAMFLKILQIVIFLLRVGMALLCSYAIIHGRYLQALWSAFNFSESLIVSFCYMVCKSKMSYRQLLEFLHNVDEELEHTVGIKIELILTLYTGIVTVNRFTIYVLHAGVTTVEGPDRLRVYSLYYIPSYCTDLYLIIHFIIYYSVYCRLKALKIYLCGRCDVYKGNLIYKSLIDNLEEVSKCLDVPLVMVLLHATLLAMFDIMTVLEYILYEEFLLHRIVPRFLETMLMFSLAFAPVFVADMMSSEAKQIKNILNYKVQMDDTLSVSGRLSVRQFSWYVSCRPFRLRACRVLPLDCTLPVTVLSVCVTYLIVVVQFFHIY